MESALVLMLRYFDIEIKRDGDMFGHRFHQALLEELKRPQCPLHELLGKPLIQRFLHKFKGLRNYCKTEYRENSADSESTLSEMVKDVDFPLWEPLIKRALCSIVKCIKIEAAQRLRGETSWAKIRAYEFSLALRREDSTGGAKLCRESNNIGGIQEEIESLQTFAECPIGVLSLKKRLVQDLARAKEDKQQRGVNEAENVKARHLLNVQMTQVKEQYAAREAEMERTVALIKEKAAKSVDQVQAQMEEEKKQVVAKEAEMARTIDLAREQMKKEKDQWKVKEGEMGRDIELLSEELTKEKERASTILIGKNLSISMLLNSLSIRRGELKDVTRYEHSEVTVQGLSNRVTTLIQENLRLEKILEEQTKDISRIQQKWKPGDNEVPSTTAKSGANTWMAWLRYRGLDFENWFNKSA